MLFIAYHICMLKKEREDTQRTPIQRTPSSSEMVARRPPMATVFAYEREMFGLQ